MAGLSFAIALTRQWDPEITPPEITIYDRDSQQASIRRDGFSLSLAGHDDTGGLYALRQLGLLDATLRHALLGLEGTPGCFKLWAGDFRELLSVRYKPAAGLPTAGIRIARRDLRRVLLDAVEAAGGKFEIIWGAACVGARNLDDGRVEVRLRRGTTTEQEEEEVVACDLVVAADGASSKLRSCLRPDDAALRYAGAVQFGGSATFADGEAIPSPVGDNWGMLVSFRGVACFLSPVDRHSVVWALSRSEERERPPLDRNDPDHARKIVQEALDLGSVFGEPFQTIVNKTDPATVFSLPARDKEPFRHDVARLGRVVFIGDSNHAASPFAGYGASLALKDGVDLAMQICAAKGEEREDGAGAGACGLERAVAAYDAVSVPRALKVLGESHWRIKTSHSTGILALLFRCSIAVGGFMLWLTGQS
ncbi:FAD/NAD(P)-binding domain-containing protein [Sodiomyces alkalinus F11]|uniref:FAD/NAD(P)-binding domain-containing protein n=1 Tax=Sodiomyces alkalinus (strain CBS 110278 / VKM F-3762 / F11) TaxID=1314773 RepID=A0A3N2PPI4_SODAK|nr:FAD/NAD(P)-binding domain-containing protein [Sodiomyces alkalinus F11]ROT36419.1 FAD/NAD(P)-binding domain-containing protein [Sodiomyces alkalinus F11]